MYVCNYTEEKIIHSQPPNAAILPIPSKAFTR